MNFRLLSVGPIFFLQISLLALTLSSTILVITRGSECGYDDGRANKNFFIVFGLLSSILVVMNLIDFFKFVKNDRGKDLTWFEYLLSFINIIFGISWLFMATTLAINIPTYNSCIVVNVLTGTIMLIVLGLYHGFRHQDRSHVTTIPYQYMY